MAKEITVPTSGAIVSYQVITEDYNHWKVDNVSGVTIKYHDETTTESISGSGQDNFKIVFPKLESTVEKPYLQETVDFPMNVVITSGICEGVSEEVTFKQQPYYTLTFNAIPDNETYYLYVNNVEKTPRGGVKGSYFINLPCSANTDSISSVTDDTTVIEKVVINSGSSLSEYITAATPTDNVFSFLLSGNTDDICDTDHAICSSGDNILYPLLLYKKEPNTDSISIPTITSSITKQLFSESYSDIEDIYDDKTLEGNPTIEHAIQIGVLISKDDDVYYINKDHIFNGLPFFNSGETNNVIYKLGILTQK